MQLCNIHFHKNAEHKAKGYPHLVGEGDQRGYACSAEKSGHETIILPSLQNPKFLVCDDAEVV